MIGEVHLFFEVLKETLSAVRIPAALSTGRIRFVVLGPEPERWLVDLGHDRCRLERDEPQETADLTLFLDPPQLDRMLAEGHSERALRFDGDETLFESLAAAMRPGRSALDLRADLERGE